MFSLGSSAAVTLYVGRLECPGLFKMALLFAMQLLIPFPMMYVGVGLSRTAQRIMRKVPVGEAHAQARELGRP